MIHANAFSFMFLICGGGNVVLLYFLPVIIIHCKSALTKLGFCNHYVIHVNELSFSSLAKLTFLRDTTESKTAS